jgi:nitrite reductase/ring-hydroxylating ferredoxin subunit
MKNIEVGTVDEFVSLGRKVVNIDGLEILLIHSDGAFFAVSNICPHAKTRLISGRIEDGTLTCSNHGVCFDLKTGAIRIDKIDEELLEQLDVDNLPFGTLKTYQVHIENGMILMEI